jgi:hypothetical protein
MMAREGAGRGGASTRVWNGSEAAPGESDLGGLTKRFLGQSMRIRFSRSVFFYIVATHGYFF